MTEQYDLYPCDLCGDDDYAELKAVSHLTRDPLHVCKSCGLVQVIRRRSERDMVWEKDDLRRVASSFTGRAKDSADQLSNY